MSIRVAVSDPLPLVRQGIVASLDHLSAGVEDPADLVAWAHRPDRRVVLLTVVAADDWEILADLCRLPVSVVVVALLADASVANYVRAISAGAAGVVPRTVTGTGLRSVFQAAVEGKTLLPTDVVRALAGRQPDNAPADDRPTDRELSWLRDLAAGMSVGRIAERAGYSERMMFRLLRAVYAKLGTRSRTEALMLARERQWI
jgi:DNA-binding NarL/FixJ family response regulator